MPVIVHIMSSQTATPAETDAMGKQSVEALASSMAQAMLRAEAEASDDNARRNAIYDRLTMIGEWVGDNGHAYRPALARAIMTETGDWRRIYHSGDQHFDCGEWIAVMFGIK